MEIRSYRQEDIKVIAELFYNTVHSVNATDYTDEQLDAWADGNINLEAWDRSFQEHMTLVAVMASNEEEGNGQIVGFADMDCAGYLDRLYVHKDFQRCGIATALCNCLEQSADAETITTHASITARPFFEKRGAGDVCGDNISKSGYIRTGVDQSGGYDREEKRFPEDLRVYIF